MPTSPPPSFTPRQKEYAAFIDRLGLRHFKGSEFAAYADRERGRVKNSLPPEGLWTNIIPTLVVIDEIRHQYGTTANVTSAYRSPVYNRAVGGESASFHMRNNAVDLSVFDPKKFHQIARSLRGRSFQLPENGGKFVWKGGIGLYRTFVHIDTRGYNADWKG